MPKRKHDKMLSPHAIFIESDKRAALNMLKTANINSEVNRTFLFSFPETTLAGISTAMATLARKNMLDDDTRTFIREVGSRCAWETTDLLVRFKQANCLTEDSILALRIASKTSFQEYSPHLIHKTVSHLLGTRFFTQLHVNFKVQLCSLALAIPLDFKSVLRLLIDIDKHKLLTTKTFIAVLETGFQFAAKQCSFEDLKNVVYLPLNTLSTTEELLAKIAALQLPKTTNTTSAYQVNNLFPPALQEPHMPAANDRQEPEPLHWPCIIM